MNNQEEYRGAIFIITCFVCTCLFFVFLIFFLKNPAWFFASCVFVLGCCVVLALNFVGRQVTRPHYQEIPQYGLLERNLLGQARTHAPLAIAEPKAERTVKEVVPIPTVGELLKQNMLGTTDLLLGFTLDGQPHWGTWNDIRTFAIAAKGRAGKTVTLYSISIQALLNGAHLWVADPHPAKQSSLTNLLKPLAPYISFAHKPDEIGRMMDEFVGVMEARLVDQGADQTPQVLIVDEYSRLMNDVDKALDVTIKCSQEYAGVGGFAILSGQQWTGNGKKLALLRYALHAVYVHRIDANVSKYLLNSTKHSKISDKLRTGHSFFKDTEGYIHELITPLGKVEDSYTVGRMLSQITGPDTPPEIAIYPETTGLLPQPEIPPFNGAQPPEETEDFTHSEQILSLPPPQETPDFESYQGRKEGVRKMLGKFSKRDTVLRIWGAKPGAGDAWKQASAEYDHIKAELAMDEITML